ncbi:signal peptidase I [Patescibacteria group bacterium]|nr:signal peptidase I [Patescibacteria group bacterium]MBU1500782.1 signal peptidase I [Patescibacteria group bacterium]MBU2080837.1 signal peptidase I [Patescibacteria group bacterium]MBU2123942.1 signal peptidase I [Patescibacteria group bacterium]MBU2194767.1 signal peptidase I [Patescibacteria group bacterium]
MKVLGSAFREILTFVVLAIIIVVPIRVFVAQPFIVEGESMHPTFAGGDYLIVDQLTYRLSEPKRGDVAIFRYPNNPSVFYIKRIIGLPGETVHIDKGVTTVTKTDGTTLTLDESYVVSEDATYSLDRTLGEDQFFVMGDNRPKSSDSRSWGALPREDLMGRAYVRLLPPGKWGILPGAVTEPQ